MLKQMIAVLCGLSLCGCAAMTEPLDAGVPRIDTAGLQAGCFYTREVRDWAPLTELNLLVYAPTRSESYLLTLNRPAKFMDNREGVLFRGTDGRICGRVGDELVMREGVAESFAITDVRDLTDEQGKQLLEQQAAGQLPLVEEK